MSLSAAVSTTRCPTSRGPSWATPGASSTSTAAGSGTCRPGGVAGLGRQRWAHDPTGQAARWMKVIARRLTADAMAIEDEKTRARRSPPAAASPRRPSPGRSPWPAPKPDRGHPRRPRRRPVPAQLRQRNPRPAHRRAAGPRPGRPAHQDDRRRIPPGRGRARVRRVPRARPARPGMRGYLARLLGHALEGRVVEHVLPIFHGAGAQRQGHAASTR